MEGDDLLRQYHHMLSSSDSISRATTPGLGFGGSVASSSKENGAPAEPEKRYHPRTYPYYDLLPYKVEEVSERNAALEEILKHLYIAVKAEGT
jgi:proteasome activator subunit 4